MKLDIEKTKLKVVLSTLVDAKIKGLLNESKSMEISGLGEVVDYPTMGLVFVKDLHVLKQECSFGTTEIDEEAAAKFYTQLEIEQFNLIKCWWHSHGNGGVFWSSTDNDHIETLSNGSSWYLSIVSNTRGQHRARLDFGGLGKITIDDLPITVSPTILCKEDRRILNAVCEEKIKEKEKEQTSNIWSEQCRLPKQFVGYRQTKYTKSPFNKINDYQRGNK